jgi:hypothetical protein
MRSRRRPVRNVSLLLYVAGTTLVAIAAIVAFILVPRGSGRAPATTAASSNETTTSRATTTTSATSTATASTETTSTPPPAPVAPFSWQAAGGIVWHWGDVDPTVLGRQVRAAGFGWVAVQLADGEQVKAPSAQWVSLFRAASGLPVGGWSVLRGDPATEAQLAAGLLARDGLTFYIADAEQEYALTNGSDLNGARYDKSGQFVVAFRKLEPGLPSALSSYCRPDRNDLDWGVWASNGFAFLPQAYVSALGPDGDPAACVAGATRWFPRRRIHPTVGIFGGPFPAPSPSEYAQLLAAAGTLGFSLFPAETAGAEWQTFGQQIQPLHIAAPVVG